MSLAGNIPVDLVLFAMIACFLVLRLRSILGRRTGFEGAPAAPSRPQAAPVIDGRAEPPAAARKLPDPAGEAGAALAAMRGVDHRFDPAQFLTGAEHAFRLIVGAFARGDRAALRPLLDEPTFQAFNQAITTREAAGETQRSEIRAILDATIEQASLAGSAAVITVRFVSDQIAVTIGRDGTPTTGTDAVTELADVWVFARDLSQQGVAWRLTAARSA